MIFSSLPACKDASASKSMEQRFPLELFELIIDFLHNDHQTLISCSLVSKSLRRRSRVHLFSRCIATPHMLEDLLNSQDSKFGTLIHHLRVRMQPDRAATKSTYNALGRLHALKSLKIEGILWHNRPLSGIKPLQKLFLLVSLDISAFPSKLSQIMTFVAIFPRLEQLSLRWHTDSVEDAPPDSVKISSRLRQLEVLHTSNSIPFIIWLGRQNPPLQITNLWISELHQSHSQLPILIRVEHLRFTVPSLFGKG